jgi:hypothetical protein
MKSLALASDGLLAGGNSLSIATRGHLGIAITVQMPRRRPKGGSGLRLNEREEPRIPKQKVIYQPYDDTDDILLMMTII